jgi:hypothetical protein
MSTAVPTVTISRQEAITIAETDALPMYGADWLAQLQLRVTFQGDGWHVEFHQWRPRHTGGGPHYVIDATTGKIVSKKYYQ